MWMNDEFNLLHLFESCDCDEPKSSKILKVYEAHHIHKCNVIILQL